MRDHDIITSFERYLLTERRVAHNTFDAYKRDLAQFYAYLIQTQRSFNNVDEDLLRDFLKDLKRQGIGARSMARKISCLKTFFAYAHIHHGFVDLASHLITPKLEKKLPQYLSETDVETLLTLSQAEKTDAGIRNHIMLYVLYTSGMRISELVNCKISGIDFSEDSLTILGKGGKDRVVPLPQPVMVMIKDYLSTTHPRLATKQGESHTTDILFPTYYSGDLRPITRQSFWLYLKELALKAGIDASLSPHHLRHSLATHLLKRGANLRSLQMLLGHEKLTTVQIYTHVETSHLRKIYDKKHPRS